MAAYFVRRIVGSIAKLWVLSFIVFYILIELLAGLAVPSRGGDCFTCTAPPRREYIRVFERNVHVDKPWPHNYVDWLFDHYALRLAPNGKVYTQASGVLIGDFGTSINIESDTPVSQVIGPGIGEMFAFLISLIAALMFVVTAQRWRRPQPHRVSTLPTSSALVTWWYLHSRRPIDAAVFRGQLA